MYQRIAMFVPKQFADKITQSLAYLDIDVDVKRFLGFLLAFGFAISIGIGINAMLLFQIHFLLGFFGSFLFFVGGVYLWLTMAAEAKGKSIELMLPDALQLISSNIKSGLTTERALFVSARPELGPLEKELKHASKEIIAGESVEKSILHMATRVKSLVFERTMWLIAKGIQSGGQIADLLVQLSDDLREQKAVQEEAQAETSMYILLILVAAAFGSPILFGVSSFIVQILAKQIAELPSIDPQSLSNSPGTIQQVIGPLAGERQSTITPEFVTQFSLWAIFFTSVFASMMIGIINSGKEKNGIRYMPFILIIALFLFYLVRMALTSVFGNLL
jgi:Flp pilus assembly protein TadB